MYINTCGWPCTLKLILSLKFSLSCSYPNNRKSDIKCSVPQDLVLGSLLFKIDLFDLVFKCEDVNMTSCADDTTPCNL